MNQPSAAQKSQRAIAVTLWKVVAIYAVVSVLWIVLSGQLVAHLFTDPAQIVLAEIVKGWLFVGITALLLMEVMRRHLTKLALQQSELERSERLFRLIADNIHDLVALVDTDGRRIYNSPSYRKFFGDQELRPGSDSLKEIHPEDHDRIARIFRETVATGVGQRTEFRFVLSDGSIRHIESQGSVIQDSQGRVDKVLVVSRDMTERRLAELELQRQARVDYLTGLVNRRHFMDQGEIEVSRAVRYGSALSVVMMDIDFFKEVNDTHGHRAGDLVLQALSRMCVAALRDVDIIGRMGGEEFAVLLPETPLDKAAEAAERLRETIARNGIVIEDGLVLHVTASFGVATSSGQETSMDLLLHQADTALYQAKESGRNRVCIAPVLRSSRDSGGETQLAS